MKESITLQVIVDYNVYDTCPYEVIGDIQYSVASMVRHRLNAHNHTVEDGIQITKANVSIKLK